MEILLLTDFCDIEAQQLEDALRQHLLLSPFFTHDFEPVGVDDVREHYLRFLKMSADYVALTVSMLRSAADALREGDAEDRAWSEVLLGYATDETETDGDASYDHHVWATNDMAALGADRAWIDAPSHPSVAQYGRYFIDGAVQHPYAVLGVKGVLEHLSIRVCDDFVRGVIESGIPNGENATSFLHHHGVLDVDHVRAGDKNLEQLRSQAKRAQAPLCQ